MGCGGAAQVPVCARACMRARMHAQGPTPPLTLWRASLLLLCQHLPPTGFEFALRSASPCRLSCCVRARLANGATNEGVRQGFWFGMLLHPTPRHTGGLVVRQGWRLAQRRAGGSKPLNSRDLRTMECSTRRHGSNAKITLEPPCTEPVDCCPQRPTSLDVLPIVLDLLHLRLCACAQWEGGCGVCPLLAWTGTN